MSELHASLGVIQIKKFNSFLQKRSFNFKYLESKIKKLKEIFIVPNLKGHMSGSFYCFSILLSKKIASKRFKIINFLKKNNIGSSIYYPHPVPRLKFYRDKYKISKRNYEIASQFSDRIICLPIGPHVSKKDLDIISLNIKKIIN